MVIVAQLAELQIVALEVTGSSPVGHPKTKTALIFQRQFLFYLFLEFMRIYFFIILRRREFNFLSLILFSKPAKTIFPFELNLK